MLELPLSHLTDAQLEAELYRRSLYDFVKTAWSLIDSAPFIDNWHVGAICEHLQAVSTGQIKRLLINIPPGCSKSLLVCVFWPMWSWASDPSLRWFFASYDQRLSTRDSVKCRALLESPWYRQHWPISLRNDQNQKTYYETDKRGYRLATSVGGHGTGEHPDFIVVDDPENVQQAESEADRQAVIDWWDLTMSSRGVSRGVRRVIIMQRLHTEDLSGHVLADGDWDHIVLPMRYEIGRMGPTSLGWTDPRWTEGELLTPRQFSEEQVKKLETSLGSYGSAGQLAQRPVPREGGMFKLLWLSQIVEAVPAGVIKLRAWDKAGLDNDGDYSAGVLMSKSSEGIYYIEDVVRGQWNSGQRNRIMMATAETDGREVEVWTEQEPGSGGLESAQYTVKQLAGFNVRIDKPTGAKEVRAQPLAAQAEAGNIRLVKGLWNRAFVDELTTFPMGKHDDQVDAAALAFNKLALRRTATAAFIKIG